MSYDRAIEERANHINDFRGTDGRVSVLDPIAPGAQEAALQNLTITQDSVVVTVLIAPAPDHRAVQINWGDDTVDLIDFRLTDLQTDSAVPEGSYKRQHAYRRNPINGLYPGRVNIILAVYDNQGGRTFEGRGIDLAPRFRCTIFPVRVRANHHDGGLEEHSEFDIMLRYQQDGITLADNQWHWEPKTLDIGFGSTTLINAEIYLGGSQFVREIALPDEELVIWPDYVDDDGFWGTFKSLLPPVEFDTSNNIALIIHPNDRTGTYNETYHLESDSGWMDFEFRIAVDLIVPLDQGPLSTLATG